MPPFNLEQSLLRQLSNEATPSESAALEDHLRSSPELRSEAYRFLCDESLLSELFTREPEVDDPQEELFRSMVQSLNHTNSASARKLFINVRRRGVGFLMSAAALLIVALGVYSFHLRAQLAQLHHLSLVAAEDQLPTKGQSTDKAGRDARSRGQVIGRVAGLRQPVWPEGARAMKFGDKLLEGDRIALESGVIELLLSTGAKVTVEGPAELDAQSAVETRLTHGKLAAAAPRTARGFTVLTPTAELVDIGTQFGVMVDDSGESELHVFKGDVVARSRLAPGTAELLHAKQDQAMRFDSVNANPARFPARESEFIHHAMPTYRTEELPSIPTSKGLALWYAADKCSAVGEDGRVGTWNDLLAGDNDFPDNAWQFEEIHRPRLVKDGAGRQALAFDGWSSFMVTSPMEPTAEQTVFIVCMPAPVSRSEVQFLFKYASFPSLELCLLSNAQFRGWVWPGPGKSCVGDIRASGIDNSQPVVFAYQFDTVRNSSKLWVNGVLRGTADAPIALSDCGQIHIGRHSNPHSRTAFFGNIYEVAVFGKMFNDTELKDFWGYFSKRYDLD